MELISLNKQNISKEHICCAISNEKDCQVVSKKSWLCDRFDDGLVFLKGNVRGKCFIEYLPAENAWVPISADGYMYIDCLWVSGQFKGHGNSNLLLDACIKDSKEKGKKGLVVLSSEKKRPFLSDHQYLEYKGFKVADRTEPFFELMYLPFENDSIVPCFKINKDSDDIKTDGFVLYYTNQCPYTAKYVPLIQKIADENGVEFKSIHISSKQEAQNAATPFTTYSLFYKGKFLTNEILSQKKFEDMIKKL